MTISFVDMEPQSSLENLLQKAANKDYGVDLSISKATTAHTDAAPKEPSSVQRVRNLAPKKTTLSFF